MENYSFLKFTAKMANSSGVYINKLSMSQFIIEKIFVSCMFFMSFHCYSRHFVRRGLETSQKYSLHAPHAYTKFHLRFQWFIHKIVVASFIHGFFYLHLFTYVFTYLSYLPPSRSLSSLSWWNNNKKFC